MTHLIERSWLKNLKGRRPVRGSMFQKLLYAGEIDDPSKYNLGKGFKPIHGKSVFGKSHIVDTSYTNHKEQHRWGTETITPEDY